MTIVEILIWRKEIMKRIFITVAVCAIFIFTRQVLDLQFGLGLFANNLLFAQLPVQNDNDNNKDVDNDENKNDEETNPFFTQLDITDSTVKHQLDQVERLLKAERHIEAIRIVSSLLENSDDFLIPPPFHPRNINGTNVVGTNPDERTTNTTLTKRLLEILRNLPDKAKEAYNLQYKSQAESLLENAIKQGSFETLQKVAKKYLPTEAGITALFFIGMYQLELGDWESALLTFDKINYTANQFNFKLDSFEPTLSLSIAACQIKLDNNNDAKLTLEKFIKKFPRPQILIGGKETWQPTNHDEIFTRIKKSVESNKVNSVASWIESSGWLLSRGVPTQNPETFASSPLLEPLWETPNFNQTNTSLFAQRLQSIVQSATETYIPALHPLVVGDLVITRGVEEITATNVNSGKRVWNQNDNNFRIPPQVLLILRNYGFGNINSPNRRNLEYGALRIKIWHDRVTNSMSSDGEKLFYVEGHSQKFSNYNRFMQQPLVIGNKTIENPLAKKSNTLTARDAKTGNLIWQVGKFNYVQKMFDKIESDIKNTNNTPNNNPNNNRNNNQPIPQFLPKIAPPQNNNAPNNNQPDDKNNDNKNEKENNVDPLFSEEELLLSETQFLGSPLPLRGNLYCICESEGLLQLFVLSASNGKLLSRVPLVQTGDRVDKDFFRNFYCLTPSASNGIIFCPTGTGMVIAVDATTVSPLWCFSYEQNPVAGKAGVGGGRRIVAGMIEMNSGANNDYFRQIFGQTGWQAASIMIDGNRVLIAPPDVPSLYCVDLLTGKLLWQMTNLYRPNALYVACIYNKIAYIVTPVSMLALSMDNGRRIWEQVLSNQTANYANTANNPNFVPNNGLQIQARVVVRGGGKVLDIIPPPVVEQQIETEIADNEQTANAKNTKRPKLVFPTPLKPTGIGIHNGDLYYIPLSGGNIGVIDLVKCSIKLISSPESLAKPVEQQKTLTENQTQNNIVENNSNVSFGNLIGLRGKFFSQSPLQVACFDQWFDLVERTKKLLEANADDAQGLLQLGKIKQVENNMDEAIKLFLRSFEVGRSEVAAYYLRAALMGAVKRDYKTWKHVLPKLESLALSSLEYGDILLAQAQGAAKDGDVDDFISVLKKIFDIEADFQVDVKFDNKLSSQLHNVVGLLMSQMKQEKGGDEQLQKKINQTAENIFNNFRNNNFNFSSSQNSELSNFFTQDILQSAQQLWREDDNWTS
ncbi:MAG: PQQ-binding-like beta-propeller repeat protein, partial [Planctomycetaceae bacterium]|nr:PQQ-binding-like beta-propeller repeat protein [Planctomycetaceae bacterium]